METPSTAAPSGAFATVSGARHFPVCARAKSHPCAHHHTPCARMRTTPCLLKITYQVLPKDNYAHLHPRARPKGPDHVRRILSSQSPCPQRVSSLSSQLPAPPRIINLAQSLPPCIGSRIRTCSGRLSVLLPSFPPEAIAVRRGSAAVAHTRGGIPPLPCAMSVVNWLPS